MARSPDEGLFLCCDEASRFARCATAKRLDLDA